MVAFISFLVGGERAYLPSRQASTDPGRITRHSEIAQVRHTPPKSYLGSLHFRALRRGIDPVTRPTRHQAVVAGSRERSLSCYSGFVDQRAQPITSSRTEGTASPSFEELAAQQGVAPIDNFETLLGRPSPEDESAEQFSASLREWRQEGTHPANPQ